MVDDLDEYSVPGRKKRLRIAAGKDTQRCMVDER